jgi:hypothetical protein
MMFLYYLFDTDELPYRLHDVTGHSNNIEDTVNTEDSEYGYIYVGF